VSAVTKKLMQARIELHGLKIGKSGRNDFAKYNYMELSDFLIPTQEIFARLGLCGLVSFTSDIATLTITDVDDDSSVVVTSPMGSAALKGCHEVQNIGAVETYQRRYLWVTAMEIVEHDALDSGAGPEPKGPELDMSPKSRAVRIVNGVKAGDAASAAIAMAGWDEKLLNSVWAFLDAKTQDTLTANWPKD